MRRIKVKFFGIPSIWIDGKKVLIPQKRVEALFYYILANEQCTRDELAAIFWGSYSESNAKKNLRNTIYKLKLIIGKDIICTEGNIFVYINSNIKLDTDLSLLLKSKDGQELLEIEEYVFLDKYYVKNCEDFENWVCSMRSTYTRIFLDIYEKALNRAAVLRNVDKIEKYANKIINIDKYNEKPYQVLMELYAAKGVYNKAINLYNQLVKILRNELDVSPSTKTNLLFDEIISSKKFLQKNYKVENNKVFYGRFNELISIHEEWRAFYNKESFKHIIISGEIGIGKAMLIEQFLKELNNKNLHIIKLNFSQLDKNIHFKSFIDIIKTLGNIEEKADVKDNLINSLWNKVTNLLEKVYCYEKELKKIFNDLLYCLTDATLWDAFRKINYKNKVIMVLNNLQWMDEYSVNLLFNIILRMNVNNVFLIITFESNNNYIENKFNILLQNEKAKLIELSRFSREEVGEFVGISISDLESNLSLADKLFKKTGGNTQLLVEMLNALKRNEDIDNISEKDRFILKNFLVNMSYEERKVIDIISIFQNGVSIDILFKMHNISDYEIIEIVDKLQQRDILQEKLFKNDVIIYVSIEILREYIYSNLSIIKRRFLHNRAAEILENSYNDTNKNYYYLNEISYHYSNTNNLYKNLYYQIKYLEYRLDYCDEFFPTIKNNNDEYIHLIIDKEKVYKIFKEIEKLFIEIQCSVDKKELMELYLTFYYLKGRTLIRDGNYEEGTENIQILINLSKNMGCKYYIIHGYLEMIYYTIKTNEAELMGKYIDEVNKFDFVDEFIVERGIIYRLHGLQNIMMEQYGKAEELLNKSINLFNSDNNLGSKNFLNIAAAYNYLGDIRKINNNYEEALKYYNKAIEICKNNNYFKALDIFYNNYGQTLFHMKNYSLAEVYFKKSFGIYDLLDSFWERSIAEGYMALININNGFYSKALEHLNRADFYSKKNYSPHEIKVLNEIKSIYRKRVKGENYN